MFNMYMIEPDVTTIHIPHKGGIVKVLIDTADLSLVCNHKWFISEQSAGRLVVMAHTVGGKNSIYLARVILDVTDSGSVVDYRDHDTLNNRRSNLFVTSKSGSGLNRKGANKNNRSSGMVGVTWHKSAERWLAQITHKRKNHYLGLFDTIELAAEAVAAAREIFKAEDESALLVSDIVD